MALLQVEHLKKIYTTRFGAHQVQALSDVSFSVQAGEFVAIMGESGSGKTTLLNILATLDRPTQGAVRLNGQNLADVPDKQLSAFRRQRLGFVFQDFNLLDTFSLKDNILLPLVLSHMRYDDMVPRLKAVSDVLGITQLLEKYPYEVSGGQKQRAAVARALITRPAIVLADEPTGNLDSKTTMEVLKLMQTIVRERNQTLVMVTHDNNLATYADRIIKIIDGKIVSIEENHKEADLEAAREETPQKKMTEEKESGENL